jgi:hypothetical protein
VWSRLEESSNEEMIRAIRHLGAFSDADLESWLPETLRKHMFDLWRTKRFSRDQTSSLQLSTTLNQGYYFCYVIA